MSESKNGFFPSLLEVRKAGAGCEELAVLCYENFVLLFSSLFKFNILPIKLGCTSIRGRAVFI